MAISKIIYKTSPQDTGTVWMDATPATATASDITAPKTAMLADGVMTTGTGSGGGGGSSYTLVHSEDIEVSTTSTTATVVKTISITRTANKYIVISIRDKAGKRAGYLYGSDNFASYTLNANAGAGVVQYVFVMEGTTMYRNTYANSGTFGIFVSNAASDGTITISARYGTSQSRIIDGTYSVKIYELDYPDNDNPFA